MNRHRRLGKGDGVAAQVVCQRENVVPGLHYPVEESELPLTTPATGPEPSNGASPLPQE